MHGRTHLKLRRERSGQTRSRGRGRSTPARTGRPTSVGVRPAAITATLANASPAPGPRATMLPAATETVTPFATVTLAAFATVCTARSVSLVYLLPEPV